MSRFFFTSYENAIVIKSREAVYWANELLKLFKSNFNLNQLAKKGKDLAKNFSLSSMVSSYEDLYRKLYYS
jgi:glycosyltransferase involved in cell wall biosynthesis